MTTATDLGRGAQGTTHIHDLEGSPKVLPVLFLEPHAGLAPIVDVVAGGVDELAARMLVEHQDVVGQVLQVRAVSYGSPSPVRRRFPWPRGQ